MSAVVVATVLVAWVGAGLVAYVVATGVVAATRAARACAEVAATQARRDLSTVRSERVRVEAATQDVVATDTLPAPDVSSRSAQPPAGWGAPEGIATLGELLEAEGLEDATTPEERAHGRIRIVRRGTADVGTTGDRGVRDDG